MPKRVTELAQSGGGRAQRAGRSRLGAGDGRQHGAGQRHPAAGPGARLLQRQRRLQHGRARSGARPKTGNAPKDASDPQVRRQAADPIDRGPAQRGRRAAAERRPQQRGGQLQSGGQQQQAAQSSEEEEEEKPAPRVPPTDPRQVALTIADAGQGSDPVPQRRGHRQVRQAVRTRFERDRSNGASARPERDGQQGLGRQGRRDGEDPVQGAGRDQELPGAHREGERPRREDQADQVRRGVLVRGGYFQDEKIWQHYRFVIRVEKVLSVVYLFGREEFFQDPKDGGWTARATGSPRRSRTACSRARGHHVARGLVPRPKRFHGRGTSPRATYASPTPGRAASAGRPGRTAR